MGYTHYWEFKKNPIKIENGADKFKQAVAMVKQGIEKIPSLIPSFTYRMNERGEYEQVELGKEPFKLCGGNGKGEPKFTDTLVSFNGDASVNHDHETCYIALDDPNDFKFNFCKTARKPYDVAVCLTLLCFKEVFGDDFKFSSDGDIDAGEEGWKMAKEIVAEL